MKKRSRFGVRAGLDRWLVRLFETPSRRASPSGRRRGGTYRGLLPRQLGPVLRRWAPTSSTRAGARSLGARVPHHRQDPTTEQPAHPADQRHRRARREATHPSGARGVADVVGLNRQSGLKHDVAGASRLRAPDRPTTGHSKYYRTTMVESTPVVSRALQDRRPASERAEPRRTELCHVHDHVGDEGVNGSWAVFWNREIARSGDRSGNPRYAHDQRAAAGSTSAAPGRPRSRAACAGRRRGSRRRARSSQRQATLIHVHDAATAARPGTATPSSGSTSRGAATSSARARSAPAASYRGGMARETAPRASTSNAPVCPSAMIACPASRAAPRPMIAGSGSCDGAGDLSGEPVARAPTRACARTKPARHAGRRASRARGARAPAPPRARRSAASPSARAVAARASSASAAYRCWYQPRRSSLAPPQPPRAARARRPTPW